MKAEADRDAACASKERFDGRAVTYGFGQLDTLVPAYAATVECGQ
jgi:hypothetical protein